MSAARDEPYGGTAVGLAATEPQAADAPRPPGQLEGDDDVIRPEPRGRWWLPRRSTIEGLRLVYAAGPVMAPVLTAVAFVEGVLPIVFIVLAGRLVRQAEQGIVVSASTLGDAAARPFLVTLAAVGCVFLLGEVIGHTRFAVTAGYCHRVEGLRRRRVMAAAMTPRGVGHLEDPEVLDIVQRAARSDWPDTSAFASSWFGMLTARVTAFSSALIVGTFRWWLAAGLLALWATVGHVMRMGQVTAWTDTGGKLRWAQYLRWLAFSPLAAKEIRIFGFEPWLRKHYTRTWHEIMRAVWRRRRGTRARQVGALVVAVTGNALAFGVLVAAGRSGELRAADLVVLAPAMLALSQFGSTDEFTLGFILGAVSLPKIAKAEEVLGSVRFRATGSTPAAGMPTREIRFEDVAFAYPSRPNRMVYEHLDLRIAAGQSLAIVGVNGAGKTTLVKLLCRLYEPVDGRITADGVDLADLDPQSWQPRVAAIFQDFVKYEMSAADNVGFGAVAFAADVGMLRRAAERVGALDLVQSLPGGWDTVLSRRYEDGVDLSGGEWQRIALARAMFAVEAGAGVLVLDEPTANLDVRAEVDLFDRFLDITHGATTILISHRFSTVRRADRIVVLDAGRVVEDGTHDELIALGGRYAGSFRLQAERYDHPDNAPVEEVTADG